MTRTMIDIDEAALAQVTEILGTKTMKDTVNGALHEIVTTHARAAAMERMLAKSRAGYYDEILDPAREAEAWR
jgi:Arc/MetJ family transcription regulator